MSQLADHRSISRIGPLHIAIIVLAVITAFIHLQKGIALVTSSPPARHSGPPPGSHAGGGPSILSLLPLPLSTLFLINFVAYIVLIVALYLPLLRAYQRVVRWLLIALAAVTIVAYFLIVGTQFNLLGYIDKPIEAALIVLLVIEEWQATHAKVA
ncbi:MAG: hypothetical protein JO123_06640 [Ktedonobacteraceae bacterium]|nr:hypothetical protein [Ktedonobacteraceae bacterium]